MMDTLEYLKEVIFMTEHTLSKDCWCKPEVIDVEGTRREAYKREAAFDDYTEGNISFEKLAETIGVNFYTLQSSFLKFVNECKK